MGYDEYENGRFVPNEGNFTDEELESVFQQSYNENYYLLDATGIILTQHMNAAPETLKKIKIIKDFVFSQCFGVI